MSEKEAKKPTRVFGMHLWRREADPCDPAVTREEGGGEAAEVTSAQAESPAAAAESRASTAPEADASVKDIPVAPDAPEGAEADGSETEALLEEIRRLKEESRAREAAYLAEKAAWETQRRLSRLSEMLRGADLPEALSPLVDHEDPAVSEERVVLLRAAVDKAVKAELKRAVGHGIPRGDGPRGLTREELRALPLAQLEARMGR